MNTVSKEIIAKNGVDKVKIIGLKIGALAIKKSALNSRTPGTLSTLLSFKDKEFGELLPVWTWVIVHPEGTFLIDTGLSSDVNQPGYFKSLDFVSKYYFEKQMQFEIKREEEIDYMLKQVGIKPESIDKIILTHLHIDHTGGMKHFPNVPILVNEKEWKTQDGAFPKLFPPNSSIQTVKLDHKFEGFDQCHYLTESKDLVMIPTPGHTRGHISIALIGHQNKIYLFSGDVTYTKKRLVDKVFSATINNQKENKASCEKILQLAQKSTLIFLPTHDSDNVQRLKNDLAIN